MPEPLPDSAPARVPVAMSIGVFIVRKLACAHRGTVPIASANVTAKFTAVLA